MASLYKLYIPSLSFTSLFQGTKTFPKYLKINGSLQKCLLNRKNGIIEIIYEQIYKYSIYLLTTLDIHSLLHLRMFLACFCVKLIHICYKGEN